MKLIPNLAEIDHQAIHDLGIPSLLLMEEAGRQISETVLSYHPHKVVTILCGPGNNGGDGFVCARRLAMTKSTLLGLETINVIVTTKPDALTGDALTNYQLLQHYPVNVMEITDSKEALPYLESADILVDALFGSGLTRPITGLYAELVAAVNRSPKTASVIAVDLPSGICSATGTIHGIAIQADETVTFAAGKPGLYLADGKSHSGRIHLVKIGIPPRLIDEEASNIFLLTELQISQWLPRRSTSSHKKQFGHVLVIGGSRTMPGAVSLSCQAALQSGAGLVTLAAPESVFEQSSLSAEIIRLPLPETDEGTVGTVSLPVLQKQLSQYTVVAIGPGLENTEETQRFFQKILPVLKQSGLPIVVDADGLNCLSTLNETLSDQFILTPHLGEAARLLKTDKSELITNLLKAAIKLQTTYGCQAVLKSATTVIADTQGNCWVNPTGNPGMATAGSGDVLTGLIASLAAQSVPTAQAAACGVYLHGLSGDKARESLTEYSMTAGDISRFFSSAFQTILPSGKCPT